MLGVGDEAGQRVRLAFFSIASRPKGEEGDPSENWESHDESNVPLLLWSGLGQWSTLKGLFLVI